MADDDLISIASPFYMPPFYNGVTGMIATLRGIWLSPDSNPLHRLYADFYGAPTSRRLLYGKPYAE